MKIEYNLTIDDLVAYSEYVYRNSGKGKRYFFRAAYSLLATVLLLLGLVFLLGGSTDIAVLSLVMAVLLAAWGYYRLSWRGVRSRVKRQLERRFGRQPNSVTGKHRLTLSPEVVTDTTALSQSAIRWETIEHIITLEKGIFLTLNGGAGVIVIPRSAFNDQTEMQQFIAEAGRLKAQSAGAAGHIQE